VLISMQVASTVHKSRVSQLPLQATEPHSVPGLANSRHLPSPLHMPSLRHEVGYPGSAGHSSSGSRSSSFWQSPSTPLPFFAAVQASHTPSQGWSQQMLSAQFSGSAHSDCSVHGVGVQPDETGYFWQAPCPSHSPLSAQVGEPLSRQPFFGSVLVGIGPQIPSKPPPFSVAEQAIQGWLQIWSQQNPSTQCPVSHSPGT